MKRISAVAEFLTRPTRFLRIDSLRDRILLFAVLAALVPAIVTAWVSYIQNKNSVGERLARQLEGVSGQATREVELWRKDGAYNLKVFTGSYEVSENLDRTPRPARLRTYLASLRDRLPDYAVLSVIDLQGRVVASSPSDAPAPPLPAQWLSEIRADRTVVGAPYWDSTHHTPVVTLVVPVRAGARAIGALAATAKVLPLQQTLRDLAPAGGGRVVVLAGDGTVVLGPDSTNASLMQIQLATARNARNQGGIVEYTSVDGVPVVGSFRSVPSIPWTVAAELPADEAFRQLARLRTIAVFVVAGLVLGVGLVAYLLGLLLVQPLDRLNEASKQVAAGDFAVELPVLGGGEVGSLTRVFNEMVVKLRTKSEELERLSVTDALTNLFNRRRLEELLDHEVRRCQRLKHPFSVVMVDVDNFKQYNDDFGHMAGDEVLVRVATVLHDSIREVDTVARYGGEEFLILMPEATEREAVRLAERLRKRVADEPIEHRAITISLGVAQYPVNGESAEAVIAAADSALYDAKRAGRNSVSHAAPPPHAASGKPAR
jgi:diguanylate cyclase (GGDEF)-like protein